ncbi:GPI ethanolamine phosphate transferase 1 [Selaginella moellendorffii]|uniref:GPI ethanolamine phosphate transferase 1 n=1 Tax=Selaginella moellendorffii TaxID=88036 RepID=UPI000D1C5F5E|nr:GPI ethanolamine phosphate transferase 1 [Selaginella moellendorffii]|eukprot:XP_024521186.1 GPI ethanolamine phosphate transferase 1 [Selaginella moellendorffii]
MESREVKIIILGVAVHALFMLSIFDIYFKSPIVHGIDPVAPRIQAPAKRLVLFVADGLRADKFFELKPDGSPRAPFLHNVMHEKGKWGVSHARPPTESRPGHVAIIAGLYEDPSAVTKGWKANPVEFDSVFNRSKKVVAFGSPDIVPIFCGNIPQAKFSAYPHEYEDFATDASFLDTWVFDRFEQLINSSKRDSVVEETLQSGELVVFLHLLGCDTNGHAHRPYSPIYLNNVEVVDRGIERVFKLMEEKYSDGRTAYVFTADHGMSDKGSHGDGEPENTETPLVAWGAGIRGPSPAKPEDDEDDGFKFVDQHTHHMVTPHSWGLQNLERVDVNQGDIAPLMSVLLGLPCPLNSVGVLPRGYLLLNKADEAEAAFANAKQLLNQFLRKSHIKQETSLFFRPFSSLKNYEELTSRIQQLIGLQQYQAALDSTQKLISLSLDGLHYFQTYDWWFLMGTITFGYVGWMLYVILHLLRHYASSPLFQRKQRKSSLVCKLPLVIISVISSFQGNFAMGTLSAALFMVLMFEKSPILYFLYIGTGIFLWQRVLASPNDFTRIWIAVRTGKVSKFQILFASMLSSVIVQLLVSSFFRREVYTGFFFAAGVVGAVTISMNLPGLSMIPAFVWASCWFLSGFTLMPPQIPEHVSLVVGSAFLVVALAFAAWWIDKIVPKEPILRQLVRDKNLSAERDVLFVVQIILVCFSSFMVWVTTSYRTHRRQLPLTFQVVNWSLAGVAILLPLRSPPTIIARVCAIFLGFAPPFLLLSIGYEALFYSGLASVLFSWILVESAITFSSFGRNSFTNEFSASERLIQWTAFAKGERHVSWRSLKLTDVHVALCFLILINVAFFGTGNVASIASFEISSVYRFITVFDPFIMTALLLFKLFIPFILVTCAFSIVVKIMSLPRLGCYFMVLILSDIMTIRFFFLVRNTGSWMEIGNSISHFGIMSAQVVFVLLLFGLSNIYTRDVRINVGQTSKLF